MEKKNTSVFYNGLIWGLIIGFAGVIYSVILYMTDQGLNQNLAYLGILISLVLLFFGTRSFRDAVRDGVLPFGPAFSFGLVAMIVSALIGVIYSYLLWTVIDPDLITKMQDLQMEKMLEKGVPEEALDQAMAITSKFMKPGVMVITGLLTSVFFGAILAIIIAAIVKRDESKADPVVPEE